MASTAVDLRRASPTPVTELPIREPGGPAPNRRFMPRVATRFIVRPLDGTPSFSGVDLSFGGMMCVAEPPLWPGNTLDIDLILPGERQPLAVRGRVVELVGYRGEVAMRIRFEALSAERRKRIASWMARLARV